MLRTLLALSLAGSLAGATAPPVKKTFTYKTVDGLAIRADVYRPDDAAPHPVVVWIHGGALIMGHRGGLPSEQLRRYLEAGFAVVSIDYRLAPEVKLPAILDDVRDAFRWVRERGPARFHADAGRIALVGHSAGGYLALTGGYRLRPRPRAIVSFYGYGDIAGEWYSRPDPHYSKQPPVPREEAYTAVGGPARSEVSGPNQRGRFYLYLRQQGLWPKEVTGRDPDREPRAFDPWCPARNVTSDYSPTLLLHGDQDTDVPFAQSEQIAAELARHGVPHELIRIPGGGHGFDRNLDNPGVAATFDRALEFLREHLAPPAQPSRRK